MPRLTERGEHVFGTLTARGTLVTGNLTADGRAVFGVAPGTVYDKSGGATCDLDASGIKSRKRRKQSPSYQLPRKAVVSVKSGTAQPHAIVSSTKQIERVRTGNSTATAQSDGNKTRDYRTRHATAQSHITGAGTHTRMYADRSGGGLLSGLDSGARRSVYGERSNARGRFHGYGQIAIIRGDDSEDLLLLGLEWEEEELVLLA